MVGDRVAPADIVVVDTDQILLDRASAAGLVTVRGDANRSDVLRLAGTQHANAVVVATDSDATSVLVTLTARGWRPRRPSSPRSGGRTATCCCSPERTRSWSLRTAGRLLGLATSKPTVVEMIEDLLTPDAGLAIAERGVETKEVGGSPRHLSDVVLGVLREGS